MTALSLFPESCREVLNVGNPDVVVFACNDQVRFLGKVNVVKSWLGVPNCVIVVIGLVAGTAMAK